MSWEKEIVYVKEDPDGRPWYVLLVGRGMWMRCARFGTRAGASAYRPQSPTQWVGDVWEERRAQRAAAAAG